MGVTIADLKHEIEQMKTLMGGTALPNSPMTNGAPTSKGWEGKTIKTKTATQAPHIITQSQIVKASVNDQGARLSTQALLEELKKTVAPKLMEENKSEPQILATLGSSDKRNNDIKALRVPSVTMASADSSFRMGAPIVNVVSLHTNS